MPSPILLPAGSNLAVKVHPVVLFSICDAYTRRRENQERVIGTLLGVVVDNMMEIKHCFTVPHTENAETVRQHVCLPAVKRARRRQQQASPAKRPP
jgi:translation initiation factor 3 subunit F